MHIIKRGKVVRGIFGTWWLVDDKGNSITRLSGDWVEKYAGQELAIIMLNGQTDASAVWWFETMASILNGEDRYIPTPKGRELVSSLITEVGPRGKEEEHEVALTDPLHDYELPERE